jgi:hypothetical protein
MSFWWVNHKQTFKEEFGGGYIWSPQQNKNGSRNESYINLTKTAVGDTIFSYAGGEIRAVGRVAAPFQVQDRPEQFGATGDQWNKTGWLVNIQWVGLDQSLIPKDHLNEIVPLLPKKHAPIQANGNGNQGVYLASISNALGKVLLKLINRSNKNIVKSLAGLLEPRFVTLTSDGYQRLESLIRKYRRNRILSHIDEIPLDKEDALNILAGDPENGILPIVWDKVKGYTDKELRALLLISIIFSRKDWLEIFKTTTIAGGIGRIRGEAFQQNGILTGLTRTILHFDLAINFTGRADKMDYDWGPIIEGTRIGPLVKTILINRLKWKSRSPASTANFYKICAQEQYNKVFGLYMDGFERWLEGMNSKTNVAESTKNSLMEDVAEIHTWEGFLPALDKSINDAGLKISPILQKRLAFSLMTKPFVILTGLSGSGKTKLAMAFAHWICKDPNQVLVTPVGADWKNRDPLVGYPNALEHGKYCRPDNGVLDFLLEAAKHESINRPYFLILDEMNLSHVEKYFADFLSAMESKGIIGLHSVKDMKGEVPQSIHLPTNLYIIGTVNIDETTYMFSPKVLDRAQVIEFRVSTAEMEVFLQEQTHPNLERLKSAGAGYGGIFVEHSRWSEAVQVNVTLNNALLAFFTEMKSVGAEFGYRTAAEIKRFVYFMETLGEVEELDNIIDIAVMQKILPKLHGSWRKIGKVLLKLGSLCLQKSNKEDVAELLADPEAIKYGNKAKYRFPLSLEKIARMYKTAMLDSYASYAEA